MSIGILEKERNPGNEFSANPAKKSKPFSLP
jgi:hypothetical protein